MNADWFDQPTRTARHRNWTLTVNRWRFGPRARIDFYVNLAFALERGMMIRDALEALLTMERDLPRGLFGRPLGLILPHWLARTARGVTLANAVRDWVGPHEVVAFAATARIGISAGQLRNLAADTDQLHRLARTMRKAMTPLLMTLALIWGCFAASHLYMFPVFESMAQRGGEPIRWIGLAGWLHGASAAMTLYGGPALLAALTLGVPAAILLARRWTGRSRILVERLVPGLNIYRRLTGITWLLAMAALLDSGRTPAAALEALRPATSPYLRERIDAVLSRPDLTLGDALLATRFDWPDIRIIHRIRLCLSGVRPAREFRALAAFEFERMDESLGVLAEVVAAVGYGFFTAFILAVIFTQNDIAISLQ